MASGLSSQLALGRLGVSLAALDAAQIDTTQQQSLLLVHRGNRSHGGGAVGYERYPLPIRGSGPSPCRPA